MSNIPVRVGSRREDAVTPPTPLSAPQQPITDPKKPRGRRLKKPLLVLAAIVIIGLAGAAVWYHSSKSGVNGQIESGKYQALFLTNGQVYFGKLKESGDGYYTLRDIFYLQASAASTDTDSDNPQKTAENTSDDVKLIKLGSEVHGPEDTMVVNRDQVLFFENLKADGKVSSSISEYQKTNK